MSVKKKIRARQKRRALRVRKRLKYDRDRTVPRISVFRSLKHMYAQIIDDAAHKTIASCSSLELKDLTGDKKTVAHSIGLELAKRAQEKGISTVVFDRGGFLYHGRVKELADGLRKGGLKV